MDIAAHNLLLSTSESDSSDTSTDEDEIFFDEVINYIYFQKAKNSGHSISNFIENIVPGCLEKEFISQFRIGKNVFEQLVQKFQASHFYRNLFRSSGGRQPISPEKHIETFLYFVGHESAGYRTVTNIFNVSLSSLHEIINRVADFICSLGPQTIEWSNRTQMQETKTYFNLHNHIPAVVGIIGGTSIVIDRPSNDPDSYVNQKGNYSVHIQGIVNQNHKFIDIFIGYPGSVREATVFKNSTIYNNLSQLCEDGYVLGNNTYPLMRNLLTSYSDNGHLNEQEIYFNNLHSSAQIYVEHTFEMLKQRFRQLYHLKLRKPKLIVRVIKACCILHNLANVEDLRILEELLEEHLQNEFDLLNYTDDEDEEEEDTDEGQLIRSSLTQELWNSR